MTDDDGQVMDRSSTVRTVLTPRATAIAAFAFAVFSMQGQGTWSLALQTVFWGGSSFPENQIFHVFVSWALATLLLAVVAALLAGYTLRDAVAAASWEGHLARAALIVAGSGALLSLVAIVGGLLRGSV